MKPFDHNPNDPAPEQGHDAKLDRAVDTVRQFMKRSEEYRRPYIDRAKQCRELYASWEHQGRSIINRANLKLPYAYSIIEGQTPQIVEAIINERPFAELQGYDEEDMAFEEAMTDFLDSQVEEMDNFVGKLVSWVKGGMHDGTAIAKIPYRYSEQVREKRRPTVDAVTGDVDLQVEYIRATLMDGPDFEPVDFRDFFPDWRVQTPGDIQGMRGIAFRSWKTYSELAANRNYKNLDELEHSVRVKGSGNDVAWQPRYGSDHWAGQERRDLKRDNDIEVWEFWGLFDVSGKGDHEPYLIVIANGDVPLRCDPNPFEHKMLPAVAWPNVPQDNEFFGLPEVLAVRPLIKEGNALRNARLDQVNLAVNRMYVVDRAAGIKTRALYTRPNGIIFTNDMQGIRELPPPEVPPSARFEGQEISADINQALGTTQGSPQLPQLARSMGRTTSGVEYINSITASRVGLKVRLLGEYLIKPMYRIMLQMNDQFITDEQWVRRSNPNVPNPFTALKPEAFATSVDFKIRTRMEAGGKELEFQKLQMLGQLLQTAEATQPGVTKWDVLFEAMGKSLLGNRYKKFIRSDMERQQMQAQGMAMEQAAQMQAGQAAPQPNATPGGAGTGGMTGGA